MDSMLNACSICAQPLRNICTTSVLILHRIEMRLDRLRLGRDFAQGERRRKKLDQDGVHMDWTGTAGRPGSRNATIQQRL